MAVVPGDLEWNDIGSWNAIYDVRCDGKENVMTDNVVTVDTRDCLIHSGGRLVATLGVSDLVIVETDDVVLVTHRDAAEGLKGLYEEVKRSTGKTYL